MIIDTNKLRDAIRDKMEDMAVRVDENIDNDDKACKLLSDIEKKETDLYTLITTIEEIAKEFSK